VIQKLGEHIADALGQAVALGRQARTRSDGTLPPLFHCPATGSEVHGFVVQEIPSDDPDAFVPVSCLACGQIHYLNLKTRRTLPEDPVD
jgi:hypothetical protein